MFEIGVFCVIVFALGYWATLFIMGRRDDVLHGEFVKGEAETIAAPQAPQMPFPGVKPASHPIRAAAVDPSPIVASEPPLPGQSGLAAIVAAVALQPKSTAVTPPALRPMIALPPANAERLQLLLLSIKRELKNASQI